jgi:hypothetical protein
MMSSGGYYASDSEMLSQLVKWTCGRALTHDELRVEFAKPIDCLQSDNVLLNVCKRRRPKLLRLLLSLGAQVRQCDRWGRTPLYNAVNCTVHSEGDAFRDGLECVRLLCEASTEPPLLFQPSQMYLPLETAMTWGNIELLDYFYIHCGARLSGFRGCQRALQHYADSVIGGVSACRAVCLILLHKRTRIFSHRDVARLVAAQVWKTRRSLEWRPSAK